MEYQKDIEKNKSEIIRISLDEYRGEKLVNVRVFIKDREGNWVPTKKGIAIRWELFPKVKEIFDEIEKIIKNYEK